MIVLLAILAATRTSPVGLRGASDISLDRRQPPSCDDPNGCRSLTDIIWSCVLTTLLCTWASVHPNIPGPDEKWPRITLRRVGLMLVSLVAPEAIIAWAWRQRQLATRLAESQKGEGWTITHGFFATMGGFMEYEGNRPIRVLLPEELESYSLTGNGNFPRISKAEIEDKSKGDTLSKGFVVVQTSWFVTQCIARGVQRLPITELELVTLAFAVLNFVIYVLWWDKPLNVQCGVRVYKKRNTEEPVDDGGVEAVVGFWIALRDALSELPAAIIRAKQDTDAVGWLSHIVFWPTTKIVQVIRGVNPSENSENSESTYRVRTFYPEEWSGSALWGTFVVMAITLTFGSIHCIGWTFHFPSNTERTLWRAASVCIIGVPIMYLSLALLMFYVRRPFMLWATIYLARFLLILYTLSRLVLLVLPFMCLRSLPLAAYHVVNWTSLIPHL